ncbi:class I SAM-dependent methyltransferase [Streptomyces microflavus]|uniref:class I SAM-dependent methyltransferase n=1 Tax=Streptomyces microflavus TaxID=1919 RepID=UPI0036660FA2
MLDIGAGTGRDAAALAALGHSVVAVGPTAELRGHGQRIHAGSAVEWVDDALPALSLHQCSGRFAAVFATAVWMHLDAEERGLAMARIAALLMPGGQFFANSVTGLCPMAVTCSTCPLSRSRRRTPATHSTERELRTRVLHLSVEAYAGAGKAAVDQVRAISDHPECALDGRSCTGLLGRPALDLTIAMP